MEFPADGIEDGAVEALLAGWVAGTAVEVPGWAEAGEDGSALFVFTAAIEAVELEDELVVSYELQS